jgi:hypothetical protein
MSQLTLCIICFASGVIAHKGAAALWAKFKAYLVSEIGKMAGVVALPAQPAPQPVAQQQTPPVA